MKKIVLLLFSNILFAQAVSATDSAGAISPLSYENPAKIVIADEMREAFKPFIAIEKYGLGIIKYNATNGYSSTGATFKIFNPSKKTIKYIWFTVGGENPVGDLVKTKTGYYKTLKGIGPVGRLEVSEWSFDYVWFTDVVETLKLTTIKIQYMDGTFRTIKYNDNLYIGENAYERLLLAINNSNKEVVEKKVQKQFPNVSEDDLTIFTDVEFSAEYPGGAGALRKTIGDYFDTSQIIEQSGKLEAELSFVIEKDGSISNVSAVGNNDVFNKEAIRVIK